MMLWFTTPKRKENHDFFTYQRKGAIILHFFSFAYCVDKMLTYICDVIKFTLNKGTAMKFTEYEKTADGWKVVKTSFDSNDFSSQAQWAFAFIQEQGCEYVKMGETMWDILPR